MKKQKTIRMRKAEKPQKMPVFGIELRYVNSPMDPLFITEDVCAVLGIADCAAAQKVLEEDEKVRVTIADPEPREVDAMTEPGLYNVMLTINTPVTQKFQQRVFGKMIPAMRTQGFYAAPDHKSQP